MTGKSDEDSSTYSTAMGMLYLIANSLTATLLGAVFFIFIARFLPSISDLGFVTGIQTIIAFFATLSSLGLARTATRFISTYIGAGESVRAKRLYPQIFAITTISSTAFSVILYTLAPYLSDLLFHDLRYVPLIQLSSIDVFLYSVSNSCIFLLYASQNFRQVTIISTINAILKFPAALLLLVAGMGLEGIIVGLIVGDAVTMVMYVYILVPRIRGVPSMMNDFKPVLNYSIPLYGSMILNFLSTKIDIYLLMFLSSLYTVGIYSPAVFIVTTFSVVLASLDQAILPYTSRIFGKSGLSSLGSSSQFISRYLFLLYLPLGFIIVAFCPKLIIGLLGERFSESVHPTMLLVLVTSLTSVVVVFNNIFRTTGYTRIVMNADAIALPFQIIVSVATIPYFGALGAAFARTTSRVIFFLYIVCKQKKMMGLNYDKNALKNGLIGSSIMALIIFILDLYLKDLYYVPIVFLVGISSYLFFLRFTHTVKIRDIEVLNNIFSGRFKLLVHPLTKILIHGSIYPRR